MREFATALALGAALLMSSTVAWADQPTTVLEHFEEDIRCGDVVGVASGTVAQRWHRHQRADGTVTFSYDEQSREGTFVATDGWSWRVVGAGGGSGQLEPEFQLHRKHVHVEIVGDGGRLGRLAHLYDGERWTVSGDCEFI